jgi:hypothetical protein
LILDAERRFAAVIVTGAQPASFAGMICGKDATSSLIPAFSPSRNMVLSHDSYYMPDRYGRRMVKRAAGLGIAGGAALAALALVLSPALAATQTKAKKAKPARSLSLANIGSFTPAIADPRLAAEFARRGARLGTYRFTPSAAADGNKAVRVAVRASTNRPVVDRASGEAASAVTALTPVSYNLGVAVGWKRFALSGDVAKVQGGALLGEREAADVGVSYSAKKFTGRVAVGAERGKSPLPRIVAPEEAYSLDVGGSYSIARNLAVTAGARYRIQRDRLQPLEDDRRDSQSVYVGTAFRF